MFFDDKKKMAGNILAKLREPDKHVEGMKPEAEVDHAFAGLHAAAEEMIGAIHNKSPHDLHKALRSFLDQHEAMKPGEEGSDDEGPNGSELAHNEKADERFGKSHYKP